MEKALIIQGGWDGHEPELVAEVFKNILEEEGVACQIESELDCLDDKDNLKSYDLIVPIWTMGEIDGKRVENVAEAVEGGVGIAGCHGGMCDAFRDNVLWQFITGGNWVSHPGGDGVTFDVRMVNEDHELTRDICDFQVTSEQYYLHVDPAVQVLATTDFVLDNGPHATNGVVTMPVAWTKKWGKGKVYYNALGHHGDIFDIPEAKEMMRRGFLWAMGGRENE